MRVGSLFSGYGGLDLAVGGDLAWYAEVEPAAIKVMEAHHPGVPNLGDVTSVDWSQVEPVDVITGGYPCQPFSNAGKRKGKDDERHLWPYLHTAIRTVRPRFAFLENVSGHISLGLADVLADLASIGWNAEWGTLRAARVGAPHNRNRLFILAYPQGAERREAQPNGVCAQWPSQFGERTSAAANSNSDGYGGGQDSGAMEPVAGGDAVKASERQWARTQPLSGVAWGRYSTAIRRWELITDRVAPYPIAQVGSKGIVNPVFVEWMMGLPEGWVTGHGLSASQELKMLGNGVVPQQAAFALRLLGAA
jgi:DNA (cytosine-5)-methyltransferase 1